MHGLGPGVGDLHRPGPLALRLLHHTHCPSAALRHVGHCLNFRLRKEKDDKTIKICNLTVLLQSAATICFLLLLALGLYAASSFLFPMSAPLKVPSTSLKVLIYLLFPVQQIKNVFERYFTGNDSTVVNLTENTITIPNHFYVSGEKIEYHHVGTAASAVGVATTSFTGVGNTTFLPEENIFEIKVDELPNPQFKSNSN